MSMIGVAAVNAGIPDAMRERMRRELWKLLWNERHRVIFKKGIWKLRVTILVKDVFPFLDDVLGSIPLDIAVE